MRNFHRKTTVLKSPFHKVVGLDTCNFIKIRLHHRCFPVKFAKFLLTSFITNKAPSVAAFEWRKISPNYSFFSTLVFFDEFSWNFFFSNRFLIHKNYAQNIHCVALMRYGKSHSKSHSCLGISSPYFFNMTWSIEIKSNTIFMYDTSYRYMLLWYQV